MNELLKTDDKILNTKDLNTSLLYKNMIEEIKEHLPHIQNETKKFYKSGSQYKYTTLDITDLTPISTIKHLSVLIEQTKLALQGSNTAVKKDKLSIEQKENEIKSTKDIYKKRLLEIEIEELYIKVESVNGYVEASIRKLKYLVTQYNAILKKIGKTSITEEEYEKEEARCHIMTAMKQALISARPRGGIIDEGNQIYMFDLGINGAVAQREVTAYLELEQEIYERGEEPTHALTLFWLNSFADKYEECGKVFAENRGFIVLDESALLRKEIENE